MEKQQKTYKWSKKFRFLSGGSALGVLMGSYYMSVMADAAVESGKPEEAFILWLLSMISLPAGLICVAMIFWLILVYAPTEKSAHWVKTEITETSVDE